MEKPSTISEFNSLTVRSIQDGIRPNGVTLGVPATAATASSVKSMNLWDLYKAVEKAADEDNSALADSKVSRIRLLFV